MSKQLVSFDGIELTSNDESVVTNLVTAGFDPSVGGKSAPIGSLLLENNGQIWQKIGALDTDWAQFISTTVSQLDDLADVSLSGIQDGNALIYNTTTSQWENTPLQVSGSGRILQVQFGPISAQVGTATIPKGTALPLITQGVQMWSQLFTPAIGTSTIRVSSSFVISASSSSQEITFAVFRDSTCIGVATDAVANRDQSQGVSFTFYDTPGTTAQITYSVRVGRSTTQGNSTWYVNALPNFTPGTAYNGVLQNNAYTIEEISNA